MMIIEYKIYDLNSEIINIYECKNINKVILLILQYFSYFSNINCRIEALEVTIDMIKSDFTEDKINISINNTNRFVLKKFSKCYIKIKNEHDMLSILRNWGHYEQCCELDCFKENNDLCCKISQNGDSDSVQIILKNQYSKDILCLFQNGLYNS